MLVTTSPHQHLRGKLSTHYSGCLYSSAGNMEILSLIWNLHISYNNNCVTLTQYEVSDWEMSSLFQKIRWSVRKIKIYSGPPVLHYQLQLVPTSQRCHCYHSNICIFKTVLPWWLDQNEANQQSAVTGNWWISTSVLLSDDFIGMRKLKSQ